MADVAHTTRKHSRIGPSAAHRWIVCPGSVLRGEHVPNRSTIFTQEGTASHEMCEYVMVNGVDPFSLLGGIVDLRPEASASGAAILPKHLNNAAPDNWNVWRIDQEMCESVADYRDTLLSIIQPGDSVLYETRLDMTHVHPDLFGTGDAMIYRPSTRQLWVIDFKYGSGVAVDVYDNEQLLTYGVGGLHLFKGEVDEVTLVVVQPRAFHTQGPIRSQVVDIIDLSIFEEFLRTAAALTDQEDAPVVVGAHCRFCPIAYGCDDLRKYVLELIGAKFKQKPTEKGLPVVEKMTPDILGRVMREVVIIEAWLKRVAEFAHAEAMEGRIPTGMKLVEKRAYRKWFDPEATILVLDLYDLSPEEYMTEPEEPELRSPAQMEKVLGKKLFKEVTEGLITKPKPGVVLAAIEDHRDAVNLDKGAAFGAVEED